MKRGNATETLDPTLFIAHEADFYVIGSDVPGEYWTREHFLLELPEKWDLSFVLWEDAKLIGYSILSRPESDRVHLHHFMLRAGYRGGGLGGSMIEECIKRTVEIGALRLSLKVPITFEASQKFYRRHEFLRIDQAGDYLVFERSVARKTP